MAKKKTSKKKVSKKVEVTEEVKVEFQTGAVTEEVSSKLEKKFTKEELKKMTKLQKANLRASLVSGDYVELGLPKEAKNIRVHVDQEQALILEYDKE